MFVRTANSHHDADGRFVLYCTEFCSVGLLTTISVFWDPPMSRLGSFDREKQQFRQWNVTLNLSSFSAMSKGRQLNDQVQSSLACLCNRYKSRKVCSSTRCNTALYKVWVLQFCNGGSVRAFGRSDNTTGYEINKWTTISFGLNSAQRWIAQ